jgi:hypothetical protein
MGDGQSINFSLDTWHNELPLSVQFSLVYVKAKSSVISLSMVWNNGNINLHLTQGGKPCYAAGKKSNMLLYLNPYNLLLILILSFGLGMSQVHTLSNLCIIFFILGDFTFLHSLVPQNPP